MWCEHKALPLCLTVTPAFTFHETWSLPWKRHNRLLIAVSCIRSLKEGEDQKEIAIEPALALDEVEPLPEDCYSRPISLPEGNSSRNARRCLPENRRGLNSAVCRLLSVTTLRQRLLQPDFQPAGASQLHPRHKHLLMKRSLRCRVSHRSGSRSQRLLSPLGRTPG